jgi:hypothetical protein
MKRRTSGFVVGSVFLSVLLGSYLAYGQQMDLFLFSIESGRAGWLRNLATESVK